jgi:hypothetical protein
MRNVGGVMPATVACQDFTTSGQLLTRHTLQDLPDAISLRDLIRLRVREEVATRNLSLAAAPGLIDAAEARRNDGLPSQPRPLDWEEQAEATLRAFSRNRYVVFVGGRQIEDLDESIDLSAAAEVIFLRLVPLVGW